MTRNLKRGFAGVSALGAAVFVGLFGWLYGIGVLPFGLFVVLSLINVVVGVASLKLTLESK